jgi:hypothetical protein
VLAKHVRELDRATGSAIPRWPTPETAPSYLWRYLTTRGPWPYDGLIAYLLYLLRPIDATITNLALCHFGPAQGRSVHVRCLRTQMGAQAAVLAPNLVIWFTAKVRDDRLLRDAATSLRGIPMITIPHPAARIDRWARRDRFLRELQRLRPDLEALNIDVGSVAHQWKADMDAASQTRNR